MKRNWIRVWIQQKKTRTGNHILTRFSNHFGSRSGEKRLVTPETFLEAERLKAFDEDWTKTVFRLGLGRLMAKGHIVR